jgi:hypothetical protein
MIIEDDRPPLLLPDLDHFLRILDIPVGQLTDTDKG